MFNFKIHFSHPWFLLLFIPAIILALLPHLKLSKRYRRTRNRITSLVLHLTVMTLAILTLSGMVFRYNETNEKNELLLLVDVSDTQEASQEKRDDFVQTVLLDSKYDGYKVGIVTFGFDQEYVVPLTGDVKGIYDKYLSATKFPDTSATNIAAALRFVKDNELFKNPATSKIVLITDGKQTDEDANNVIRSIVASGTRVDTAYISSEQEIVDVQVMDILLPDYHVNPEEECEIGVNLQIAQPEIATIELYDNNQLVYTDTHELAEGNKTVYIPHAFAKEGLHELRVNVTIAGDSLEENNEYTTYLYLENYNRILIFEHVDGESEALKQMLNADDGYQINVMNIKGEGIPKTAKDLCEYDQVILNNIAYADMPLLPNDAQDGFMTYDEILNTYVSEYGGGLFTVGGSEANDEDTAHAYNKADMKGTTYQDMLPVQIINYTPPVGVVFIIDRSGSMGNGTDGESMDESPLEWAKGAVLTCLEQDVMSERDYVGIMTLDDEYEMVLPLTPRTQEDKIRQAVASIKTANGLTIYDYAINRAGIALRTLGSLVDKKHIIIVSDGMVSDGDTQYEITAQNFYEQDGITLSVLGVGMTEGSDAHYNMTKLTELTHGRLMCPTTSQLITEMRKELKADEIKEVNYETFNPYINISTSPLVQGLDRLETNKNQINVTLDGFYGVKARATADVILMGAFDVPIYAQWKYGNGMVGSFMCDLNGRWSSTFMGDTTGRQFIDNVVKNLMPTENIRPNDIEAHLKEDNYTNKLSINTVLNAENGERLEGSLMCMQDGEVAQTISLNSIGNLSDREGLRDSAAYVTLAMEASNNYSRCEFVIKKAGVYKFVLKKLDKDGNVLETLEFYKALAYSEEYDVYAEEEEDAIDPETMLQNLAKRGNGAAIADLENPHEIFEGFVTALNHEFDPRFLFMILALILFLTDVAVRKFKFKWPHELVREYKKKKNQKKEEK